MRNKTAKTNLIKNDNKCFDYTATPLALNYKKWKKIQEEQQNLSI